MTRTVAIIHTIVATKIRTPVSLFLLVNPSDCIIVQNGAHRSMCRNPEWTKTTRMTRQPFCIQEGAAKAGPARGSHMAPAAANREGQLRNSQSIGPGCAPAVVDSGE